MNVAPNSTVIEVNSSCTMIRHFRCILNVMQSDLCITCREFSAVEVESYNRLNSIEPVIVPDEVFLQALLCYEFAICI